MSIPVNTDTLALCLVPYTLESLGVIISEDWSVGLRRALDAGVVPPDSFVTQLMEARALECLQLFLRHRPRLLRDPKLMFPAFRTDDGSLAEVVLRCAMYPSLQSHDAAKNMPVHEAARVGNEDALSVLLTYGADMGATNAWGQTPLHVCCSIADDEKASYVACFLNDQGVSSEARDAGGNTPIHIALHRGMKHTLEQLCQDVDLGRSVGSNSRLMKHLVSTPRTLRVLLSFQGLSVFSAECPLVALCLRVGTAESFRMLLRYSGNARGLATIHTLVADLSTATQACEKLGVIAEFTDVSGLCQHVLKHQLNTPSLRVPQDLLDVCARHDVDSTGLLARATAAGNLRVLRALQKAPKGRERLVRVLGAAVSGQALDTCASLWKVDEALLPPDADVDTLLRDGSQVLVLRFLRMLMKAYDAQVGEAPGGGSWRRSAATQWCTRLATRSSKWPLCLLLSNLSRPIRHRPAFLQACESGAAACVCELLENNQFEVSQGTILEALRRAVDAGRASVIEILSGHLSSE